MARVVVQYPLQDLGMHQRAIEECRGHGYDSRKSGSEQVGPPTRERYRDIVAYFEIAWSHTPRRS
jgi:hypothetical protein